MRHLLHIIILSLLMIMGGNSCMASCDGMALIADGITTDVEKKSNSDRLVDLSDPEPPLAEAVFSDAGSNAHRVCNSRPQRLIPSNFARIAKQAARTAFSHYSNHLNPFYGRKNGHHKAPLHVSVSGDYFIALRHIIR